MDCETSIDVRWGFVVFAVHFSKSVVAFQLAQSLLIVKYFLTYNPVSVSPVLILSLYLSLNEHCSNMCFALTFVAEMWNVDSCHKPQACDSAWTMGYRYALTRLP